MTEQLCAGRVAIVTGAGRGLGREHALALAHHGARVVVNDVGVGVHGEGHDNGPAAEVVAEIEAIGGQAVANTDDIADSNGAQRLVDQAVDVFGGLDVVVNNAGILRDRMVVSMTDDDWDAVMRVHLRGTFTMTRSAAVRWRELAKAGEDVDARIINTSSPSGLFGNPGQSNYGAAKAGIAAFTVITAKELGRYGVTVNAVSPRVARTRMTTGLGGLADAPVDGFALPAVQEGESVLAIVQVHDATHVRPGPELVLDLLGFCHSRLARFKQPRAIEFREALPRLPTGKLAKHILRDEIRRRTGSFEPAWSDAETADGPAPAWNGD